MTSGERAIWAAAFIDSIRDAREEMTKRAGLELGPPRVDPYMVAANDAARAVRAARVTLSKLVEAPAAQAHVRRDGSTEDRFKEHREAMRAEAIDMLRDMLGVTETAYRGG